MNHIVGVADMKVAAEPSDVIVTHALGSCLGLMLYDPEHRVAAMLHAMLPDSSINQEKARANPCMFVDTGVPRLFAVYQAMGGRRENVVIKSAGCGEPLNAGGIFRIGSRNFSMLRKLLWKNRLMMAAQDIGGTKSRTVHLHVDTGRVVVSTAGEAWDL